MKKCRICGIEKELVLFGIEKRNTDGRRTECKECKNKTDRAKYKNRSIKEKALKIYSGIESRCSNANIQENRPKYIEIENKLNREEFVKWYTENHFDTCQVDRIDNDGDYEMSNIQLLSLSEHNRKKSSSRIFLDRNIAVCTKCKRELEYSKINFFTENKLISKYNPLGVRSRCKKCEKEKYDIQI